MLAPPDRLVALLEVVEAAVLRIRDTASRGAAAASGEPRRDLFEIAALSDAIHNLPALLRRYEDWDERRFRDVSLASYDRDWGAHSGLRLAEVYDRERD